MSTPKYEIAFDAAAWEKWWLYCNIMPGEVGCFGYVTLHPDSQLAYVDDLFLVPQAASAAEVDFIKDGLPYAVEKAVEDDRLDDLRFCIHSHGEIGTHWSGTDEKMIATMGVNADWFVSCVTNRKGSMKGRIDVFRFDPLGEYHFKLDDLRMYKHVPADEVTAAEALLKEFVSEPVKALPAKGKALGKPRTHGKPYRIGGAGEWRYWNGEKLVTLKDEGDDVYSFMDGGLAIYVDEDGDPLGFASAESTSWTERPTPFQKGWGRIGEDVVVITPSGEAILDKFGATITDEDLLRYELEELMYPQDLDTWGVYLRERQVEAEAAIDAELLA